MCINCANFKPYKYIGSITIIDGTCKYHVVKSAYHNSGKRIKSMKANIERGCTHYQPLI